LIRVGSGSRGSQARADLPAVENFIKAKEFGASVLIQSEPKMLELRFNSEVAVTMAGPPLVQLADVSVPGG
jgi:hypothetical protein